MIESRIEITAKDFYSDPLHFFLNDLRFFRTQLGFVCLYCF